jgi:predicted lipoprotein with Yx(FWY)xxD motif
MKLTLVLMAAMMLVFIGCTQQGQIVGNDSDIHGCKASAGYSWCEAKQKCIRPFEENCTQACTAEAKICPDGSAVGRTGPDCEFAPCPASATEEQARSFCGSENVAEIYVCGDYVRVVSSLLGGGSTYYKDGQMVATCPVVGPDSMSELCRQLLLGNNCVERKISCTVVGNDSDAHGCKGSAGYSWCEAKQKCIRPWEEACEGTLKGSEVMQIAEAGCGATGNLTGNISYNPSSKTYWIGLDTVKAGCSPACVVWEDNRSAEVNWRCTGLLPQYTVMTANSTEFGEILTDLDGMTLYVFTEDSADKSECGERCVQNWPPLLASGDIVIPKGIPGTFGAFARDGGVIQVSYNGMPLYRYSGDKEPGDAFGNNVGETWFVAQTNLTGFPK